MERDDEQFRYTRVSLLVEWDANGQDHPMLWDYELLLGCRAEILEARDSEPKEVSSGDG